MQNILIHILLLGAVQGLFLAAALILRKQNTLANKILVVQFLLTDG